MKSLSERFWPKVDRREPDECWPWLGACGPRGYGRVNEGGRGSALVASRVAYELTFGPIPAGLCALHSCDNPPCCNPSHLWLGTYADNNGDMAAKGRANGGPPTGERNGSAKLTAGDVREIRRLYATGHSQRELARRFGITQVPVGRIVRRETWSQIQ